MNIYDFDKTIYDGDSSVDFYLYSLKKNPSIIRYIPLQLYGFIMYLFGFYSKVKLKEKFYTYLQGLENIDNLIKNFWDEHKYKVKEWYMEQKQGTDIIISASPEFLLKPMCSELNIQLIGSIVDKNNGKYYGENCYGEEKVNRFYKEVGDVKINRFYSDSLSDTPLAIMAKESFIVQYDEILDWSNYKPKGINRIYDMIFARKKV